MSTKLSAMEEAMEDKEDEHKALRLERDVEADRLRAQIRWLQQVQEANESLKAENEKLKSPEQLAKSRIPLAPSNSNCGSEGVSIGTIG